MSFPLNIALIYFLILTVIGFLLCGFDKFAAKKQMRRVPEKWLFIISALGGSVGMYAGMLTFRHKNSALVFRLGNSRNNNSSSCFDTFNFENFLMLCLMFKN